jgi:hypothetical protein
MMNERQNKRSETLADWLAIATEQLCDDAKARVAFEIEGHYKDAVDFHRTDGKPLNEAQGVALDELGDPKTASRRLRKKHLTQKQLETLRDYKKAAQKPPSKLLIFSFSILSFVTLLRHHEHEKLMFIGTLWVAFVLIPWIRYVFHRLYPTKSSVESLVMVSQFFGPPFAAITFLLLLRFSESQNFYIVPALRWFDLLVWWLYMLVLLIACARAFYWFRIWQRLQNDKRGHGSLVS